MGLVFARFGYLVVNISYRLAPKHPYPAAIEDTCMAYTWMAERVRELGGDPDARRGRRRIGGRQPDHRADARGDPAARRGVGARGVRLRRRAARRDAVLRDARGVASREILRAPQAAPLDRWNDPRRLARRTCMGIRPSPARTSSSRIHCASSRPPPACRTRRISIARCRRSSRRSAREILSSTTRAASKKRSRALNVPCEARYYPGGHPCVPRAGLESRLRAAAGAMRSRSSIATCGDGLTPLRAASSGSGSPPRS